MNTYKFEACWVEVKTKKPFADIVAAFARRVPAGDPAVFTSVVTAQASPTQIEEAIEKMVGDFGFIALANLDAGPLVSLLGKPKEIAIYLIGNPILANRMFEQNPAVRGHVRADACRGLRGPEGITCFTHDLPSSTLSQFDSEEIRSVARILDDRLRILADDLAA